ncbi:MAG: nitroreductase family protein, partial [Ilumatobacteraceae bacterium]
MTVGDRARFDSVAEVIRARRTSMKVDPSRDVDDAILGELFDLASWAPCHKRTWPWEFCVVRGDSRLDLGQGVAAAIQRDGDPAHRVLRLLPTREEHPYAAAPGIPAIEIGRFRLDKRAFDHGLR